jgi:hypothetical protein
MAQHAAFLRTLIMDTGKMRAKKLIKKAKERSFRSGMALLSMRRQSLPARIR